MKNLSTLFLILLFLVGLSLLLYPTVADHWNSLHQTRAVMNYTQQVAAMDTELYDEMLDAARAYNLRRSRQENRYKMTEEELAEYSAALNISGNGIMGTIEIPVIDVTLPIYHGTEDSVLQVAIGHIEWSSLPVGGQGTHCVLSGHRGLPSARLFTDLDRLVVGDTFLLQILDETLTYEVDQILIVLPEELEALQADPQEDYCTLVTCTPYGVNSHRMLVRGHRVENAREVKTVRVTADAVQLDPLVMTPLVAAPMLLILLIWLLLPTKKRRT